MNCILFLLSICTFFYYKVLTNPELISDSRYSLQKSCSQPLDTLEKFAFFCVLFLQFSKYKTSVKLLNQYFKYVALNFNFLHQNIFPKKYVCILDVAILNRLTFVSDYRFYLQYLHLMKHFHFFKKLPSVDVFINNYLFNSWYYKCNLDLTSMLYSNPKRKK